MKNILRFVFALGLVALGVWLWMVLFPSPERVITRRLEKLAKVASVRVGESYLVRMAGAQSTGGFFADSVDIDIDVPGVQKHSTVSRDDIVQGMMAVHLERGFLVKFPDINVTVAADENTAQADVTVDASGSRQEDLIVQEIRFTLRKIDGAWVITKMQTVRSLS